MNPEKPSPGQLNTEGKMDLHLHTTCSDGTDRPEELLEKVRAAGISMFSVTDHDQYQGCLEIRKHLKSGDPQFLNGIEFSCKDAYGKYHILGYRYDAGNAVFLETLRKSFDGRMEKAENRFRFLKERGFSFTDEERNRVLSRNSPGKPHFVALLLSKGYVRTRAEGFSLMSAYRETEYQLTPADAIHAIREAGGIPVLAHGIFAQGNAEHRLPEPVFRERVSRLKQEGLIGLEGFYPEYTDADRELTLSLSREYDLLVTAGSDYHGANKKIQLGDTGPVNQACLERFLNAVS